MDSIQPLYQNLIRLKKINNPKSILKTIKGLLFTYVFKYDLTGIRFSLRQHPYNQQKYLTMITYQFLSKLPLLV